MGDKGKRHVTVKGTSYKCHGRRECDAGKGPAICLTQPETMVWGRCLRKESWEGSKG